MKQQPTHRETLQKPTVAKSGAENRTPRRCRELERANKRGACISDAFFAEVSPKVWYVAVFGDRLFVIAGRLGQGRQTEADHRRASGGAGIHTRGACAPLYFVFRLAKGRVRFCRDNLKTDEHFREIIQLDDSPLLRGMR